MFLLAHINQKSNSYDVNKIVFRGDQRVLKEIFSKGFTARGTNLDIS